MSDLISRQAAIDELIAMREHIESRMSVIGCTAYEMAIEALREPERATGEWLHDLLQDAIDDGIITETQAVRIMDLAKEATG